MYIMYSGVGFCAASCSRIASVFLTPSIKRVQHVQMLKLDTQQGYSSPGTFGAGFTANTK